MTLQDEIRAALGATVDLSDPVALTTNLVFFYQAITASERLLLEAAQEADGELKDYYLSHLQEEAGHAAWLRDDLLSAGIDASEQPLMRVAVEMAGTQYYLMKHVSPAALLGYMAVLEGLPTAIERVEELERIHGTELLRTLRYHAENDIEHRKELFGMIERSNEQEIIRLSALQTARYLDEFTQSIGTKEHA